MDVTTLTKQTLFLFNESKTYWMQDLRHVEMHTTIFFSEIQCKQEWKTCTTRFFSFSNERLPLPKWYGNVTTWMLNN